jgi:hypothetical protein
VELYFHGAPWLYWEPIPPPRLPKQAGQRRGEEEWGSSITVLGRDAAYLEGDHLLYTVATVVGICSMAVGRDA